MKNRYDQHFWEFEQKNKDKGKSINTMLNEQFNSKIYSDEIFKKDYLESICLSYHLFDRKLKEWVRCEVMPHFTEETLISCYLMILTDALMLKDINKINSIMKSFVEIGLIKNISLEENKIILLTKNNELVKFKCLFGDEKERKEFKSRCHSGCEFLIKNNELFQNNCAIVTLKDSFIGKYPIYHSIILLKEKYVVDPARNLFIKLDDYKKLFKMDIIMCIDRNTILEEIDKLTETDDEFNNSELNNVLKLAIRNQFNYD